LYEYPSMLPQHVVQLLNQQKRDIERLEQDLQQLKKELADLKEQPKQRVEKIEYHFDQLKIEKLEGTLIIGVTPGSTGEIDEWSVNGQTEENLSFPLSKEQAEMACRIQDQIIRYLDEQGPAVLNGLQEQYQCVIGEQYKQLIIDDLKQQVNRRVRHYLQNGSAAQKNMSEEAIVEKMKQDNYKALVQHFDKRKKGEN